MRNQMILRGKSPIFLLIVGQLTLIYLFVSELFSFIHQASSF